MCAGGSRAQAGASLSVSPLNSFCGFQAPILLTSSQVAEYTGSLPGRGWPKGLYPRDGLHTGPPGQRALKSPHGRKGSRQVAQGPQRPSVP